MFGQSDMAGHPEVGLGLLLVMAVLMVTVIAAAADDIALVPLMSAGVGTALDVVFADLQFGEHLPRNLQL